MPYGIPTATFAVGKAGAKNAALFAVSILAVSNKALFKKLDIWRKEQSKKCCFKTFMKNKQVFNGFDDKTLGILGGGQTRKNDRVYLQHDLVLK